ncbi:MAG: hypothetical protein ACYTFT_07760 [Planctomycetota bacterium]|jgi:hypothetical protein
MATRATIGGRVGAVFAFLCAFLCISAGAFAPSAQAQYIPEWEDADPPARPSEYRTNITDTWIRITPHFGFYNFGNGLALEGRINEDWSTNLGLRIEFEPADMMLAWMEVSFSGQYLGDAINSNVERELVSDATDNIEGKLLHISTYVGLKNPELKAGPMQTILGLGLGTFGFLDYDGDTEISGGANNGQQFVPFENAWMLHASAFIRFDFDLAPHFKLGFDTKVHLPFYAYGDQVGDMLADEFDFNLTYMIVEPAIYFSIAF